MTANAARTIARQRYEEEVRPRFDKLRRTTDPREFRRRLLDFVVYAESVFDLAKSEAFKHDLYRGTDFAEVFGRARTAPIVELFEDIRNKTLKEGLYPSGTSNVVLTPAVPMKVSEPEPGLWVAGVGPEALVLEEPDPRAFIAVKGNSAAAPAEVRYEFWLDTEPFAGRDLVASAAEYLAILEHVLQSLERLLAAAVLVTEEAAPRGL